MWKKLSQFGSINVRQSNQKHNTMELQNYLNDGANYKAQAILAILRGEIEYIKDVATDHKKVMIKVGRFENCREQGYVFSLFYDYHFIKHYAVYEHRNSDEICVLISNTETTNTPNASQMFGDRGRYDVDKYFHYNEIVEAADYIEECMRNGLIEYCENIEKNEENLN